ncbi:MAG TPA: serine/threonine-protein kinase, partial [Pseudomonadota bacterium]|nr:serine/threonine-protein kinase [Pseudomonadota bacterium]
TPPTLDPRRLRELFDELVDLPAEEADRRLARDFSAEPALRQALARLLAADRGAEQTGPLAPHVLDPSSPTLAAASPSEPALPTRLGRFHVVRRLGEGGMGVVYDAYDDVLDRRVALKVLGGAGQEQAILLREARALARLSHPHVVPIYEVGEQAGRPFIAMERIEGQPLSQWLATTDATIDEKLRLLLPVGAALAAAHEQGVIHRDFKPQNVLVGRDGRARVLDFGIAALAAGAAPPDGLPATETGADHDIAGAAYLAGTPAYMAPEQLRSGEVTPLCDQFAFAVVLYRAVYGQAPFAGDDLGTLRESVLSSALRPPPRRAELPDWLWPILSRALATDPAGRFPSMKDLLAAIWAHLPNDPKDDPLKTRRGRTQLIAAFLACTLILASVAHRLGPQRMMGTPQRVVAIAFGLLVVAGLLVGLFFRRLSVTPHGRRSVG